MTLQIKNTPDGLGGSIEIEGQVRLTFEKDGSLSGIKSPLPSEINTKKLVTMDLFGCVLATSGYQKLPSGLIIQWGAAATDATGKAQLTLPIAFPNSILQATCNYFVNAKYPNICVLDSTTWSNTTLAAFIMSTSGVGVQNAQAKFIIIGH